MTIASCVRQNTEYNKKEASSEKGYPGVQEEMKGQRIADLGTCKVGRRDVWL